MTTSPATPPYQPGPLPQQPASPPHQPGPLPASPAPLLGKLKRQFDNSPLADLLAQLPTPIKKAGSRVAARYQQLSTTQKVVGGVLLLLAVRRLTRSSKGRRKGAKGPKKAHQAEAGTLHELLHFVNDRVAGYQKAVEESQDPARRGYYQHLVSQSQQFAQALNEHLRRLGGGHEANTTLKGKLYRRFMATAAIFTGHDEQTVLASNVHGEQWAIAAYKAALDDQTLHGPIRQEVERQYRQSQQTYQELKNLAT